jgi:FKBP-type peptidyl-prolyl cis-trans isomerase
MNYTKVLVSRHVWYNGRMNAFIAIVVAAVIAVGAVYVVRIRTKSEVGSTNNVQLKNESPTITNAPTQAPVTELKIEDVAVGGGQTVKSGDTVVINYEGKLTTGEVFDSSYTRGKPFETQIGVGHVIKGWDEGVIGMKAGGKRKLTIPSDMAYGPQGVPGTIPPNATLIFTLELLEIK